MGFSCYNRASEKVTNFRCSFGKILKFPVLELIANKTGDAFFD